MRILHFFKEHYFAKINYLFLAAILLVIWLSVSIALFALLSPLSFSETNLFTMYQFWQSNLDSKIHTKIIFSFIIPPVVGILIFINTRKSTVYGRARWAHLSEARKAAYSDRT